MIKLGANSVLFAGYGLETAMQYIAAAGNSIKSPTNETCAIS